MLVGIGVFWRVAPGAAEVAFGTVPDSDAALRYAVLTAVFKAIGDVLGVVVVLCNCPGRRTS